MTEPDAADLAPLGDLAGRAGLLRRAVRGRYDQEDRAGLLRVAELITQAVEAAAVPDLPAAAACLAEAETVTAAWAAADAEREAAGHATRTAAGTERLLARLRRETAASRAPGDVPVTDTVAWISAGVRGQVRLAAPPDPHLVIASDGSYRGQWYGWAYVTSTGQWGMRAGTLGADPSGALLCELFAAAMAAGQVAGDGVLLCDSRSALDFLARWQRGDRTLPRLSAADKKAGRRHKAAEAARVAVAGRGGLGLEHVCGHRGHLLNEAADVLAKMARRWRAGEESPGMAQMQSRAELVVASFMRSWHGIPYRDGGEQR